MCLQRSTSGRPLPRLASPHSGSPGVHDSTCFPSCLKAICTAKWPFLAKPTFLAEEPRPDLANTPLAQLVWTIRRHTKPLLAHRQDSLLSIHVQFGSLPETSPSSDRIGWVIPTIFGSIPTPDFGVETTLPSIVPADGTTPATSIIFVSPNNGFTGTVTLSEPSLPADLTCTAIIPSTIPDGSGHAMVSCSSSVAGTYNVTIIGTSYAIRHSATSTFRFATFPPPEFTISAITPLSFAASSTATSGVTVSSLGGFDQQVNLTSTVYPSFGLSISVNPQSFVHGSGASSATFNSSTPGDYTVTITGTSKSLSHTTTIIVAVTLAGPPDFAISASSNSLNVEAGSPGTTRITITSYNGFTGSIALEVSAPAGVSCDLSTTSIQSSGESILTCSSRIAGYYRVTIGARGGAGPHSTTVDLHVAAVSPVAPAPSTIRGLASALFYVITGVIIMVVVAGAVLALRRSRLSKS